MNGSVLRDLASHSSSSSGGTFRGPERQAYSQGHLRVGQVRMNFSLSQEFWDRIFSLSDSVYYVRQMMNDPKEITTMNETFTTQINQSLESMFAGMQERMSVEDMQRVHGIVI